MMISSELYFFFLVSLVAHTLASSMLLDYCRHDERDALMEFKHEFLVNESNSSPYYLSSWNKSSDCCSWEGVACDARSGEVISLDLHDIPLNNSLKPNSGLFKLHQLRSLTLQDCNLYGEIPSSLGNLSHLTDLELWGNHLVGEVPASIGFLTQLRGLDLGNNKFSGNIPLSFANLTKLSYLRISDNQFSGEIFPLVLLNLTSLSVLDIGNNLFNSTLLPDMSRFHNLEYLNVAGNSFFGPFPTSLFMIPSLKRVVLLGNQFNGPIEFRNTSSSSSKLQGLYLGENKFDGPIPNSISNFTNLDLFKSTLLPDMSAFHNLEYFEVAGNSFSGPFPTSLFMIPSLTTVDLTGNQFNGPIEFRNPSSSSKLQNLDLGGNKFDGPIPKSISKFPNLLILDLSYNNLSGPIPRSLSNLVKLRFLGLSNNKLEGEIPGWLGGLSFLSFLTLSHNSFSSFGKSFEDSDLTQIGDLELNSNSFRGPLPHWICKLRHLELLDLSNNSFSGSIPQCFSNTIGHRLIALNLQNNNLSGILPTEMFLDATMLMSLDVSGNKLEGKLPESLINCTSLELLNVGRNRIKDKFPSWLGSLTYLQVMILRSNEFYGPLYQPHVSIGFESLKVMDISHNDFSGTLPPFYFSNWRGMINLTEEEVGGIYLGYMNHSEHISYGHTLTVTKMITMELVNKGVDTNFEQIRKDFKAIDFSGNSFYGKIPISIGLLKGLHLLNLSGNAFTNTIPQSLANLTNLEALDLSRNQLSGQIPRDLGSLSFLSIMNFSHNNLQGPIPRGTQFQRQNCSVFMDNPRIYGLEDVCGETHVPNPTPPESKDLSEPQEQQVISWIAAAIAYGPGMFCGLVIGHIFFSSHKHKWFV